MRFSVFDSASFLLNFIFLLNKEHGLFEFKRHNSFENKSNGKDTNSFVSRRLIFKLQQEVWKFNELPKDISGDDVFKLRKSKL